MTSLIALSLDLELFVAVDNNIEIFADGLRLGEHHGWSVATFSLPADTSVLAFNARNSGGPGVVLASLSNGIVTDDTWLCSVDDPPDDGKMMTTLCVLVFSVPISPGSNISHRNLLDQILIHDSKGYFTLFDDSTKPHQCYGPLALAASVSSPVVMGAKCT